MLCSIRSTLVASAASDCVTESCSASDSRRRSSSCACSRLRASARGSVRWRLDRLAAPGPGVTFARGVRSLLRQTECIEGILDRAGAARSLELKEGSTAAEFLLFEMVEADFVMTWLLGPLQRMLCALGGHDSVFCFERDRLSLRCLSCGYRTS